MCAKACAGRDAVFIDHTQVAPTHVVCVMVASKAKRVIALEPAVIGVATVLGFAKGDHDDFFQIQISVTQNSQK